MCDNKAGAQCYCTCTTNMLKVSQQMSGRTNKEIPVWLTTKPMLLAGYYDAHVLLLFASGASAISVTYSVSIYLPPTVSWHTSR